MLRIGLGRGGMLTFMYMLRWWCYVDDDADDITVRWCQFLSKIFPKVQDCKQLVGCHKDLVQKVHDNLRRLQAKEGMTGMTRYETSADLGASWKYRSWSKQCLQLSHWPSQHKILRKKLLNGNQNKMLVEKILAGWLECVKRRSGGKRNQRNLVSYGLIWFNDV